MFAEGTLYNGIKLFERGVRNEAVWSILQDSVRTPEHNAADIEAMIAATRLGRDRFLKLVGRYGVATVLGRGRLLDGLFGGAAAHRDREDPGRRLPRRELARP